MFVKVRSHEIVNKLVVHFFPESCIGCGSLSIFSITGLEEVFSTYLFLCHVLRKYGGLGCCAVNQVEEQIQLEASFLPLCLSQKDFVGYLFLSKISSLPRLVCHTTAQVFVLRI